MYNLNYIWLLEHSLNGLRQLYYNCISYIYIYMKFKYGRATPTLFFLVFKSYYFFFFLEEKKKKNNNKKKKRGVAAVQIIKPNCFATPSPIIRWAKATGVKRLYISLGTIFTLLI